MDTKVTLSFADGEYTFWLPCPQIFELERTCEASMIAMEAQMRESFGLDHNGEAVFIGGGTGGYVQHVREVIRLGLIGGNGGMVDGVEQEVGPIRAKQLVDLYVYPARPLVESLSVAWKILNAAVMGVELKKKADPEPRQKTRSASRKAR